MKKCPKNIILMQFCIIKIFKLQDKFSFKIVSENISNLKELIKNFMLLIIQVKKCLMN